MSSTNTFDTPKSDENDWGTPYGPDNTMLPKQYEKWSDIIDNFEVYNDDIYVMGFNKTGTTWTQELVWCLQNNLDFEKSKNMSVEKKFPLLELSLFYNDREEEWFNDSINFCKNQTNPRLIKTHFPWNVLPKQIKSGEVKPRIVYIHRDPKDTCVSLYTFFKRLGKYNGTFEDICEDMLANKVLGAPFWQHVNGFLARKDLKHILVISYEEFCNDLRGVVLKVAAFLEKSLTEPELDAVCHHVSFDAMKQNQSVNVRNFTKERNEFLGTGKTGRHKEFMTQELIERFDQWTTENRR